MINLQKAGYHGIALPDYGVGLDGGTADTPYVFVSHAHSDHVPRSKNLHTYATPATSRLMKTRGFTGDVTELDFYQPLETENARIRLYPAGHILGSAMIFIETDEGNLLYTGDFRIPPSPATEGFDSPDNVDFLIAEATFGLPVYRWAGHDQLFQQIRDFASDALIEDKTPVFFCYNLGKAQEVMHALAPLNRRVQIHGAGYPMCPVYEDFGVELGQFERYNADTVKGSILITPSNTRGSAMLRITGGIRTAYVSGWAAVESRRAQLNVDKLIPLSDHLDFFELINWCRELQPRHVYITHTPNPDVVQHYLSKEEISSSSLELEVGVDD